MAAGGAEPFLRYKKELLQYLADHPPRVSLLTLRAEVRPPADLPAALGEMVRACVCCSASGTGSACFSASTVRRRRAGRQAGRRCARGLEYGPETPAGSNAPLPRPPHPTTETPTVLRMSRLSRAWLQKMRFMLQRFLSDEVWLSFGPKVYSQPGLETAELRPFPLPRDVGSAAPRFPPACPAFKCTAASCSQEERCQWGHAAVRLFR